MRPARAAWLLYVLFVLYGGTIPFHFTSDHAAILHKLHSIPLSPWISPETGRRLSIPDTVQNILFFVPFGVFGMLAAGLHRMRARRIVLVTAAGLALSLAVETLQLLEVDRVASVADLATNSFGAFAGAVATLAARGMAIAGFGRLESAGAIDVDAREWRPVAIWTVVLLVAAWQPFDATLELGSVATKVRMLQRELVLFTGFRDEGITLLVTGGFVMALAAYLRAIGVAAPARWAAIAGACLVTGLEASQLLITSRMPTAWDVAVGSAGAIAGAGVWSVSRHFEARGISLGLLTLATAAAVAMAMLSPFEFTTDYHSMGWFPLLGYYSHTTFETVSHVIELALLYFPLGYAFGVLTAGNVRWQLVAIGAALLIAAPIEALQGFVPGRYPDVSDVAVSLAGMSISLAVGRRCSGRAVDGGLKPADYATT